MSSISLVIPVYNGSDTLPLLLDQLMAVLPSLTKEFEILLINDGSPDHSWQVIQALAKKNTKIRGINMMRNYGQHNALLCGIREAKMEVVITMDDDLQHPPREIPKLIAKLQEGYDVVYGCPKKMPHSIWRNFFSRFTKKLLASVMGVKTVKELSAFRAIRTDIRKAFQNYNNPGVIIDALLAWGTTRFAAITVHEDPRTIGKSNYNFFKLTSQAFLILTGFSTFPLRFASWLGFCLTLVGFVIFVYVIIIYWTVGSIPGFPFLSSIISIFSGAQLFALGIFGEYLARIFDASMKRPAYIIKEERSTNQNPITN
ncbi:MAG: glycosyltransferase family 2 protein [Anaerolineaceae bacterium]|nr:glycosyltransferase family 2 protein [Anaerolineaceae bacterium]